LRRDSGAVARHRVGAFAAAMLHVAQGLQRPLDGLVNRCTVQASDERDAAAVMLVGLVVQPVAFAGRQFGVR
jgi:hypothetical protein